jgi:hypothetical protein
MKPNPPPPPADFNAPKLDLYSFSSFFERFFQTTPISKRISEKMF